MLILEIDKLKKYYNDRCILDIDSLLIYSEDKIGVVGENGSGKTTLLRIITGEDKEYNGTVKLYGSFSYMSQLHKEEDFLELREDRRLLSQFNIKKQYSNTMSSGEKTRVKIAESLDEKSDIIFLDEPTNNLDIEGTKVFINELSKFNGAVFIVSHNRNVLDSLCNKILEIKDGKIKTYKGNYKDYKQQKKKEREREEFLFEEYEKEKRRLLEVIEEKKQKIRSMKKAPSRMGNSEARLQKMHNQKGKRKLDNAVKAVEKRIERLEERKRPKDLENIYFNIEAERELYSKIVVQGEGINLSYGALKLYEDAAFKIYKDWKVAFIGPNGCGKSSLIKLIINEGEEIKLLQKAKVGYFNQELNILKEDKTLLDNLKESSPLIEGEIRKLLSTLLFKGEDVYKRVESLSGGERVKASIGKLILEKPNFLLLDEPTNFLDIYSIEAVETALKQYKGTILFVSHDRDFINSIADHIMYIEDKKLKIIEGNYDKFQEYLRGKDKKQEDKRELIYRKAILENKLAEVLGRLSIPSKKDDVEELNNNYEIILKELKIIKEKL